MLAEFLKALRDGVEREQRPTLLKEVSSAREVHYARQDGTTVVLEPAPPLRSHRLSSFTDLIELIETNRKDDEDAVPVVFHDQGHIQAVLDKDDRREVVVLALHHSFAFSKLGQLAGGQLFDIPQLVAFLRQLHVEPDLLAAFRRVDFTRASTGRNDVQHGRETLGRAVESAVQQADKIPETFFVATAVYTTAGLRVDTIVSIEVFVTVDHAASKIELRTNPDDMELALDRAHAAIRSLIPPSIEAYRGSFT